MPHTQTASDLTPFATYLRDIDATPLLRPRQEQQLAWRAQDGDAEARDHLVRANLRLVVSLARRYSGRGLPLEDLVAEGNLGLLRSVETFDPSLGLRFVTYASYWVKQCMKRAVINTAKTVRIPAYMAELLVKWRRATGQLQEDLGRDPTQEEVAAKLGLSAKRFKILQKAIRLHNPAIQEEGDGTAPALSEMVCDRAPAPMAVASGEEDVRQVLGLIDRLGGREASVLRLRFGLGGEEPKTLKEIGERLGLTRERVRQIERDALAMLRERLEAA